MSKTPSAVYRHRLTFIEQWCTAQISSCPLICLQEDAATAATEANTCDADNLTYNCVCDNGLSPNASMYSQTLPYFICTQNNEVCVDNCANGNSACASACREDHPCGAQNPTRVNTSTISTMSATGSSSATGSDAVYTGFGGDSAESTSSSSSDSSSAATRMVLNAGEMYGLAVVGAGIFTGFTLFL